MPKINILTDETISKIAAGEVVERPASVVKELIENSLDAGADSIEIEVEAAGQSLIRVADNGEGMNAEDAKLAFLRHATSKIKAIEDLESVHTLGFRGEALSSIAAVSHVDIMSSTGGADDGIYAYLESGEILKTRPVGRAKGTTIEVRNLFYNVPARKKFLKKEATELAEIVNVVGRYIIAGPGREFKLTHNDRCLLHAVKGASSAERIRLVMGADVSENLMELSAEAGGYGISGFVSSPANTRKDRRAQMFFVNGRFVKSRVLSDALFDAYRSMLERGRYPAAVLFMDLPPSGVDVNVHPTKLQIKFGDERAVKEAVSGAVRRKFEQLKRDVADRSGPGAPAEGADKVSPEKPVFTGISEVQTEFTYDGAKDADRGAGSPDVSGRDTAVEDVPEATPREGWHDLPRTDAEHMFQIGNSYIVQLDGTGVTITDQHAAHERILYEYFGRITEKGSSESQNLLFPTHLDLSAREAVIMEKVIDAFRALGFLIEPFGDRSYVVQAVPAVLKDSDIKKIIYDILDDLSDRKVKKTEIIDELIKLTACRAAIKAGDELNEEEMIMLLEQLGGCSLPFTCPHGRPTMIEITLEELEKRFHRK